MNDWPNRDIRKAFDSAGDLEEFEDALLGLGFSIASIGGAIDIFDQGFREGFQAGLLRREREQ